MRLEASDRSEMVSQMLFGDVCHILQKTEHWYQVRTTADSYQGWVNPKQLTPLSDDDLTALIPSLRQVHDRLIPIEVDDTFQMMVPMGARIPNGTIHLGGHTYRPTSGAGTPAADLSDYALRLLGAPYLWGGKTLMGVDCSGLVQVAAANVGIQLPRDASQQALVGQPIQPSEIGRNDLCFFANDAGRVTHVGISLGDGRILHASGNVHIDRLDANGIYSEQYGTYTHRLHSIRRLPHGHR